MPPLQMCQLDAPQRHLLLERLACLPETAHLFTPRTSSDTPPILSAAQHQWAASRFSTLSSSQPPPRCDAAAGTAGDGGEADMDRLLQEHVEAVRQGCAVATAALDPAAAAAVALDPSAAAAVAVDPVAVAAVAMDLVDPAEAAASDPVAAAPAAVDPVAVDPVAAAAAVDPADACAPPPGHDLTVQLVPEFLQYAAGGAHEVKMVVSLKVGVWGSGA